MPSAPLGLPADARLRPERDGRIALISCYFGAHEPFNPAAAASDQPGVEAFVFTDQPGLVPVESARAVVLEPSPDGPAIQSRLPKLCPHLFLTGFDWVIYVDNNARLLHAPARIIHKVGKEHPDKPAGRYLFRHRRRACAWDEADECLAAGYMTAAQHDHVTAGFAKARFPRQAGLYANTVLIQRMGSDATDRMNEAWFASLSSHTRRDQVMLPFLLWRDRVPFRVLKPKVKDWAEWPVFSGKAREQFRRDQQPGNAAL